MVGIAVCRGLATLCPVALTHVWLFSLCSSLNLQSLHHGFSVFVGSLTMFVMAHTVLAAIKCTIFYEPSVTGGKSFSVWNSKMREVVWCMRRSSFSLPENRPNIIQHVLSVATRPYHKCDALRGAGWCIRWHCEGYCVETQGGHSDNLSWSSGVRNSEVLLQKTSIRVKFVSIVLGRRFIPWNLAVRISFVL